MILQGLNASRGRMDMKVDTSKIRWTDISTVQNLTEDEADKIAATERLVGQGALIDSGIGRLYKRTGKMDIAWSNEKISRRRAAPAAGCHARSKITRELHGLVLRLPEPQVWFKDRARQRPEPRYQTEGKTLNVGHRWDSVALLPKCRSITFPQKDRMNRDQQSCSLWAVL